MLKNIGEPRHAASVANEYNRLPRFSRVTDGGSWGIVHR
jgi:hypothetical protein